MLNRSRKHLRSNCRFLHNHFEIEFHSSQNLINVVVQLMPDDLPLSFLCNYNSLRRFPFVFLLFFPQCLPCSSSLLTNEINENKKQDDHYANDRTIDKIDSSSAVMISKHICLRRSHRSYHGII